MRVLVAAWNLFIETDHFWRANLALISLVPQVVSRPGPGDRVQWSKKRVAVSGPFYRDQQSTSKEGSIPGNVFKNIKYSLACGSFLNSTLKWIQGSCDWIKTEKKLLTFGTSLPYLGLLIGCRSETLKS